MSYNVITTRSNPQVIIDQATLEQLQKELGRRVQDLERLRIAIETLAACNEPDRFTAAAMAMVNQLASRWKAERASLGFLKGRYVRLKALSHTEKFTRQMRLVQDIESAMEESLDQDVEVIHPAPAGATFVSRATEQLAVKHGPSSVVSLPLRRKGKVEAVLLLERKADQPFVGDEIETLRLTCDLVTPRIVNLHDQDKWFGAKLAASARRAGAWAVGPRHTWAKVAAIAVFGLLAFALFAQDQYRVTAPFSFQAIEKQVVPAPYEAQLKSVRVQAGDFVLSREAAEELESLGALFGPLPNPLALETLDSTLATLDTLELVKQVTAERMEELAALKQKDIADRDGKHAEALVFQHQAAARRAQIELLEKQIADGTIRSPISGVVLAGDLKQRVGTPLKKGDVMFEIGEVDDLRAEINVPEEEVGYLTLGQRGELASASFPDQRVKFTVERIAPMAVTEKQANVVKVRVQLEDGSYRDWMRPGMEGEAKVDTGKASYASIYTRKLVNWIRMKLWI